MLDARDALIQWQPHRETHLGGERVEGVVLPDKESRDWSHGFKTPDVLQNYEQVAVGDHEGGRQHGVAPAVPHHPQHARPHEEDKRQPADVGDAPGLKRTGHRLTHKTGSNQNC